MENNALIVVITTEWNYNTKELAEDIYRKYCDARHNEESKLFSFEWNTKEISQVEWEVQECHEMIILNAETTKIVGFKEYSELGEPKKAEELKLEDELLVLNKEIWEKTERADAIKVALDDPDFQEYLEHKLKSKEAEKRFIAKKKAEAQ